MRRASIPRGVESCYRAIGFVGLFERDAQRWAMLALGARAGACAEALVAARQVRGPRDAEMVDQGWLPRLFWDASSGREPCKPVPPRRALRGPTHGRRDARRRAARRRADGRELCRLSRVVGALRGGRGIRGHLHRLLRLLDELRSRQHLRSLARQRALVGGRHASSEAAGGQSPSLDGRRRGVGGHRRRHALRRRRDALLQGLVQEE
jgi:hypothetical protein